MKYLPIAVLVLACIAPNAIAAPKMIAYSANPNPWFDEHAAETAQLYDGFFFSIGSWDGGTLQSLGVQDQPAADPSWRDRARSNLAHLRDAGATQNLLAISFGESEPWPSSETLLDKEFTAKMARHFTAIGSAAKNLGFCGVSIDVEYPYKRYLLDHPVYTYVGYTADDLMRAAAEQGRAAMTALLDAFPEAVIFLLPGELGGAPICRAYTLAMLAVMAERDAPGGMHLGYERSYCLLDPASQVAIARIGDCAAEDLLDAKTLAYWKKQCTVAPGVWPLHMVETGGQGYPVRPWDQELAELKQQLATLRAVAKRYVWSYSGMPVWLPPPSKMPQNYGLPSPAFDQAEAAVSGWHDVLKTATTVDDPRLLDLIGAVREYDEGKLNAESFCARFGTPPEWMVLGYLGNPFKAPAFSAPTAALGPIDPLQTFQGRDGVVRWVPFFNYEPTGHIQLRKAFDYRATDNCSVVLACNVTAVDDIDAFLWLNFDDGGIVRLDDQVIADKSAYPEKGHGLQFKDRYLFEYREPIKLARGKHRLVITSINSHGVWGVNFRIGDADAFPIKGLSFSLE